MSWLAERKPIQSRIAVCPEAYRLLLFLPSLPGERLVRSEVLEEPSIEMTVLWVVVP
jgi:hypothetical protein